MKRAIFVSVGTVAGLSAALHYTPQAPALGGSSLALGGLGGEANPSPKPTATQDTGNPTPVPSVSASAVVSKPPPATSTVFTGSVAAARPYGVVQVQIKVVNHRVTQIAALQAPNGDQQSYNISVQAIPMLVQEALAAQSANIANISGASHTCDAFKTSLAAALHQAGL